MNRKRFLLLLSAATFIIFFQIYMVAPIIPVLSTFFNVTEQQIGLAIPAYLIPYGISTLFYGLLADKIGTKKIILLSLFAFALLTGLTSLSQSASQLIAWRFFTGVGASGVVPISLAWVGRSYSYKERGKPLGWLFGAMAGGSAFGAFAGALLEAFIGWEILFLLVSMSAFIVWIGIYLAYKRLSNPPKVNQGLTLKKVFNGYKDLIQRGKIIYVYVLLNGIFTSGVFTWLGSYFEKTFSLTGWHIGLALLGYGIPGFLLGPFIGGLADRFGRNRLLPAGLTVGALSCFMLSLPISLVIARISVITLSLGYDLTQPSLAGIITKVGKERPGQAMGLNVFMLFIGFGLGSYLFGLGLQLGFTQAFIIFSSFQMVLSLISIKVFRAYH